MVLLALDTSTRQASIALCSEESLYGEYTWYVGNNHSVELLDRIQRLVAECGITMSQLDAIAVATGPGSFNGVRVAVATAKALAFALQKPLIGISTLDVIAAQQQQSPDPVCAVIEAGRTELYAACYLFEKLLTEQGNISYVLRRLSDYLLLAPDLLAAHIQEQANSWVGVPGERRLPPFLFCGELSETSREVLHAQMQAQSFFINALQASRRASVLAMLALQRLHEGKEEDALLLEPLYLRRPSITTSTRKQPLLGGKLPHQSVGSGHTEREEGALRH